MVYARIADRTVADEYFNVTARVEASTTSPTNSPPEGTEMRKLRAEMHRRMLGNGCRQKIFESLLAHLDEQAS